MRCLAPETEIVSPLSDAYTSFNKAAANSPRKRRGAAFFWDDDEGFNEAAANSPRKQVGLWGW